MVIDGVVWFTLLFVATYAVASVTGDITTSGSGIDANLTGTAGLAALVLWLGLSVGYHTILEWRYGKTIGKHLVNVRVADADGSSPTFGSSLLRNVVRLVDVLPFFYVIGLVVAVLSDRNQRLGDKVGGTVVVKS